jgi:hypothetical protein
MTTACDTLDGEKEIPKIQNSSDKNAVPLAGN